MNKIQRRLEQARKLGVDHYGKQAINLGETHYRLDTVPTGSLMLDYKLGIGGFPYGHMVEVFGANKMGKSSAIGYPVLANVQKQGKLPALLAVEPRFTTPEDREWGMKFGVDPDMLYIAYPDHSEEAFGMLRELVFGNLVDYIMIDSVGGLGTKTGAKEDGVKKAYGISGDLTSALNDIMPRLWKNNIGLLIINQQRQGEYGYESPGGEGLKHHARIRIQLKPGKDKYFVAIDDEKVMVGREVIARILKNNMAQGSEKEARFQWYFIETQQYGFGIDVAHDIISVGTITGVINKSGSWLEHPSFGKLQGKPQVREYLAKHPEAYDAIREEVMGVMIQRELEAAKRNQQPLDSDGS
jgi:recombination protein RecA